MIRKISPFFSAITAGSVTLVIIISISIGYFEKNSAEKNSRSFVSLVKDYNAFFISREFSKDSIQSFLSETSKSHPNATLIAVRGDDGRVVLLRTDNAILSENGIYDEITRDIYGDKYPVKKNYYYTPRYYGNDSQTNRYYVFVSGGNFGSVIAIYPRKTPFTSAILFILGAAGLSIAAGSLAYYAASQRKKESDSSVEENKSDPQKEEKITSGQRAGKDTKILSVIGSFVQESGVLSAKYTALSLGRGSERHFSCKNGRYYKTKHAAVKGNGQYKNLLAELEKGSPVLKNKSHTGIIPLVMNDLLIGYFTFDMDRRILGKDITNAEKFVSKMADIL